MKIISYDEYVKNNKNSDISKAVSELNKYASNNKNTSNKSVSNSASVSSKPMTESEARVNYELTKFNTNLIQTEARKKQAEMVKKELSTLGVNAPETLNFSFTNPKSTFVKNENGTTTIKSQYDKNQEQAKAFNKSIQVRNKLATTNPEYQALTDLYKQANNEKVLAKYNYDVAKEANYKPTLLDKTIGVPIRAAKDFFNTETVLDPEDTRYYTDIGKNYGIFGGGYNLPTANQIRQENIRNSYGDDLFGKVAKFGTDVAYNATKVGISSALNKLSVAAGIPVPVGSVMYFSDMGADSLNSALQQGYTGDSAVLYALVNVASEMVTEYALGGLSDQLLKTKGGSLLGKKLNTAIGKVFKNDTVRSALSNAMSEGTEEFVQEYIEKFSENLILKQKSIGKSVKDTFTEETLEDALYSTLVGMGSGGLFGVMQPSINTNNTGIKPKADKQGNINIDSYATQLQEALNTTKNQSTKDSINQTLNYLALNKALGNETVQSQTLNQNIQNLAPALNQLTNIAPQDINTNIDNNTMLYQNTSNAVNENQAEVLPGNGNDVVLPRANQNEDITYQYEDFGRRLQEAENNNQYMELNPDNEMIFPKNEPQTEINTQQRLQYAPTSNEKVNNLYNTASQYFNNSEQTTNLMNTLSKVIKDKGYNIVFDNTNMNGINGKIETKNGEVTITLNPDSPRAFEFVAVHEITHAIETNSLKNMIMSYAKKNGEFNAALDSLKKAYGTNDINSEVIADISGQLLGNQEFINNLSMEQPGLFKRLYNNIKAFYHKLRGWKSQDEFVQDLMNKWEYAYATQQNNLKNQSYSIDEGIDTNIKGEYKHFDNYYDFAKELTSNKNDLAKDLLFKNYNYRFEVPTTENETSFYHGTDAIYDYDALKTMDYNESSMVRNYGDYFYITPDKSLAETYGKQIAQFIIPNDKIISLDNYRQALKNGQTDSDIFKKYWAIEMPDNEYIVNDIKPVIEYSKNKAQNYINSQENENKVAQKVVNNDDLGYNNTRTNLDLSTAQPGDLKNEFYDSLTPKQWRKYHNKMNKVMDSTYGNLNRTDVIDGKLVSTEIKNHTEQVVNVFKISKEYQNKVNYLIEEANNYGYSGQELQNISEEMFGKENVFGYDTSSGKFIRISELERNSEGINANNRYNVGEGTKGKNLKNNKELDNSSFSLKQKQNDIIQKNNPLNPELGEHTWINNADDIKTFQEALKYDEYDNNNLTPDFTSKMVEDALKTGEITVYSSYDIKQGTFVTPSKMEAQSYAGDGKVYSKKVSLQDVAWIDSLQGQYAKVGNTANNKSITPEIDDYVAKNNFKLNEKGILTVKDLTNKQINDLVRLYKTTGYDDVSTDYLVNRLKDGDMPVQREVADRFIEKELGYKPKVDTTKVFEDAEGNKLTKQQVEFFKDSDVRDIRGRLIPVYHRTNADFTVFDSKAGKQHGSKYGKGFYFSITPENYGNNTMKVYLNAKEGDFKYLPKQGYYIVQNANQIKNVTNTSPTTSDDIRYSKNATEWQSYLEENYKTKGKVTLNKDNENRTLSKQQQDYFKDSKIRDNNGHLITVYHTTTDEVAQFNEFNPVGTKYYRFGEQVVNYYTNSKNMSGSYSSQNYQMADTTKINNMSELNNYLHNEAVRTNNVFNIEKSADGKYILSQESEIGKEAKSFINKLSENEMQQMRDNIYYDEKMAGTPYEKAFSWDKFDKELQTKYNNVLDKYMGTADLVAMQQQMMKYIENPNLMSENTSSSATEVVKTYNSESEMFRNIKQDIQNSNWSKNSKIQYEGYLDIKNPYVIDAEERNWNQVVQQSNDFIDELESRVPQDIKDNLTRLYQESANKSADARESYDKYQKIISEIDNESLTPNIDNDIRKMNSVIKRVGIDNVILLSEGSATSIGVSGWYTIADVLKLQGVIGDATESFIIDEFRLPNNVKEWITENLNKEINYKGVKNLKQLYENNREAYDTFDKYRLPQDYFIERISTQDDPVDLGNDLNDMFEQRAEIMGADAVGEEIAQAASVNFSKPELIRLWGTSKTTNDIVKEVLASNKDGITNYDGVVIKNVYDYGGRSNGETTANDVYVTFNSNQFKAYDNTSPTNDADIRYSKNNKTWQQYLEENYVSRGTRTFGKDIRKQETQNKSADHKVIQKAIEETNTLKGDNVLKAKPKETTPVEQKQDNSRLSKAEQQELNNLNAIKEFASSEELSRIEYLENKRDGLIKYPELKQKIEFKDISKEYTKYKNNIGEFNPSLLNQAEDTVKGYRNTKTKEQWLDVAEQIGTNFKGTGQELTNYAVQSWFEAKPNDKNSLNRQGKGYVKFSIDEWVNSVYKGAGVGEVMARTQATTTTTNLNTNTTYTASDINNMFQFEDNNNRVIALPDEVGERIATKTNMTPMEVGNLQNILYSATNTVENGNQLEITSDYGNNIYTIKATKVGDAFVIDDVVKGTKNALGSVANIETTTNDEVESIDNKKSKIENGQTIGEVLNKIKNQIPKPTDQRTQYKETVEDANKMKESKFYRNATETSQFITEDNRTKLSEVGDLKYYESITNEESLNKASKRLKDYGTAEAIRWIQQDNKTSSATDVAEGWILLKNYQDAGDFDSMVAVAKKMRQMGTIAGQTIQAYNILARLTPEGMVKYAQSELSEAYEAYAKNKSKQWVEKNGKKFDLSTQEVEFIVDNMKQVQQTTDERTRKVKLGEIQRMLTDKLPPEQGSGIKAWMRISMLFNPKTQIRNIMGNAVITPVNMVGDFFAAAADRYIAKKTGVRTTGNTDIKNYLKGFKKGVYESYDDFKRGINTRNVDANRFELGQAKSFNDNTKLGKALNRVDALNSFLLDAGDRGFYEGSFTNSINNQLALNNTTKVTQDMIDIATSEALQRTWQDNNNYTKFVLTTRNMLNKVNVKGYGLGDLLIPFAKTPANLTKAIVDYSPAGMVNAIIQAKNLRNNISTGTNTAIQQHQFAQTLGKATAGTLLYVAAYGLAKAGIASGQSDDDKDTRDFIKNTLGISSYSIKIGNKSFTYDWAQPIAAPLSIMTNIVNSKNNKGQALLEAITSSLDSAGSILLEQSFLKSINDVLTDNDGIVSGIENAMLDLPARGIPTFMKQIVDMTDSTQRQTFEYNQPLKTAINKLKAKIPGLSQTLQPAVDTLGREIQKYGGKNNIFNVFLNPANVNTSNISEAAKEIYKVYKQTGDKTIMPRVAPYYINSKGEKTILNTEQRKSFQTIAGNIIENSVYELQNNSQYNNMSYEDKSTTIKNIVDYAYNKARKDVLGMDMAQTYNKVNEWIEKGGRISDYYANKEEANFSLESPAKYSALKNMGVDYYDYQEYQKQVNAIKKKYSGTSNAAIRKQKVYEYVNSLKATSNQKVLLFKMLGNYSIKNFSSQAYQYINSFNISAKEKKEIWNTLF